MSTDEIPGWALEAVEVANFRHDLGLIPSDWPRVAATIVEFAPQPSAEVAPDFVDHSNWRVALTAYQQERDRLREELKWKAREFDTWIAVVAQWTGLTIEHNTCDILTALIQKMKQCDRLREAGNRLAKTLESVRLDLPWEQGNRTAINITDALAHWRATTEG